jgi:ELMO/CED-12 family
LGLTQLHSFCTIYPVLAQRIVQESGSSSPLDITEPWYPFALMGIHLTDAILKTLASGLLQETIIMKLQGNAYKSISRICQDLFGIRSESSIQLIIKTDLLRNSMHIGEIWLAKALSKMFLTLKEYLGNSKDRKGYCKRGEVGTLGYHRHTYLLLIITPTQMY